MFGGSKFSPDRLSSGQGEHRRLYLATAALELPANCVAVCGAERLASARFDVRMKARNTRFSTPG
ncbi:hypothetical protein [Kibdelosporangium philippinense]|uniref:hypothetical protein n=1 Tax=Kibdelosporangium philippinense TaxID=211113 RepID=UPI00360FF202